MTPKTQRQIKVQPLASVLSPAAVSAAVARPVAARRALAQRRRFLPAMQPRLSPPPHKLQAAMAATSQETAPAPLAAMPRRQQARRAKFRPQSLAPAAA